MQSFRFAPELLNDLITALDGRGYQVVGPTPRDGAVVYDHIDSASQLPKGLTDSQEKGTYRLESGDPRAYFAYNVGPHSWKKFLFPNNHLMWSARTKDGQVTIETPEEEQAPFAFIGVRSCEMAAIGIQDVVFTKGPYPDDTYRNRREKAFIIGVNCTQAGKTCFCTSMGGSPEVGEGADLVLTEILDDNTHFFVAKPVTDIAKELLESIGAQPAAEGDAGQVAQKVAQAESQMGRQMNTEGLRELLANNRTHSHWDEIGDRCLNCTNCTMVCPTCFCFTVEDHADLTGENHERKRQWDSCFNLSFSYQHGGSVRQGNSSRYRQWLTHKLSSWHDQFDSSGCVGCGRCITWCPVGIDITEEVRAFQEKTQ